MRRWRWFAYGVAVGTLALFERRRPLRVRREPDIVHTTRNLAIAALAAVTTQTADTPIVSRALDFGARHRIGLLRILPLPRALRVILGFLLLDYTIYLWHWLNHRSDTLWRFHEVHHADLDLDSTTALRFHFGELALAALFRAAQVLLLGVDRPTLRAWQKALFASVLFHHSNLALPEAVEQQVSLVVVTPRLHGIHHATRRAWMDTNYSSLLSVWDRLHRTLKADVPQAALTIGVDHLQDPAAVTLERALALPFSPAP